MAGTPSYLHACALLSGSLVLALASCEGRRPLPAPFDDDFGVEDDGDGDGDDADSDTEPSGSGEDHDTGADDGEPDECFSVVDNLEIDDMTHPESVACVEHVTGDLTVGATTQLLNLDMLAKLQRVDGTLYIRGNTALTSLAGLTSLEHVNALHIRRNRNLSNLTGLDSLKLLNSLSINNNEGMTSLVGLPGGLSPQLLEVDKNDLLPSLDGLPVFTIAGDGSPLHAELRLNPALVDLGGLSDCCSNQAISLIIDSNNALTDLDGLEGFVTLESLELYDNFGLVDFDGLDNLVEIDTLLVDFDHCIPDLSPSLLDFGGAESIERIDTLHIEWAESLTRFDGLHNVSSVSKLLVRNNEALEWSDIEAFGDQTQPSTVNVCGGIGTTNECPAEPCPMF